MPPPARCPPPERQAPPAQRCTRPPRASSSRPLHPGWLWTCAGWPAEQPPQQPTRCRSTTPQPTCSQTMPCTHSAHLFSHDAMHTRPACSQTVTHTHTQPTCLCTVQHTLRPLVFRRCHVHKAHLFPHNATHRQHTRFQRCGLGTTVDCRSRRALCNVHTSMNPPTGVFAALRSLLVLGCGGGGGVWLCVGSRLHRVRERGSTIPRCVPSCAASRMLRRGAFTMYQSGCVDARCGPKHFRSRSQ